MALVLSGVIYFFASNWAGFDRLSKVALSISLMLVFYFVAYFLSRYFQRSPFLGEWFLVGGSITFGVTVALLGQIYNSHADSYMLFVIWLIPVCLFAVFTRFQPFYVMSYVLLHLALWYYLFPSSFFIYVDERSVFLKLFIFMLINLNIFILAETGKLASVTLKYLSFLFFHCLFIYTSGLDLFTGFSSFYNFLYVLIIVGSFYYLTKVRPNKGLIFLLGLITVIYALVRFAHLSAAYYSEGFFVLILLFVIGLVLGNVYLVKWLNRRKSANENSKTVRVMRKALVGIITALASILGTIAYVGLVSLMVQDFPQLFFFLSAVGFIFIILVATKHLDATIRYTLLVMGYLLGTAISVFIDVPYYLIFFMALLIYCWFHFEQTLIKWITYILINGLLFTVLIRHVDLLLEYTLSVLILLQLLLFVLSIKLPIMIKRILQHSSLFFFLFFFGWLSFNFETQNVMYYVSNILYFIIVTTLVFSFVRRKRDTLAFGITLTFWFGFLFVKYYDFVWKLLHKSIALFVLGTLFILISLYYDRRREYDAETVTKNVVLRKLAVIVLIIVLQVGFVAAQVVKSEYLLANGTQIKLELAPVDPRSLLQGDYVRLSYDISSLTHHQVQAKLKPNQHIQVILRENQSGVYEQTGVFKIDGTYHVEYIQREGDVAISGRFDGNASIIYGLESYFVPEGTGLEVQDKAKYAYVKVAQNGDALLVELSED